MKDNFDVLISEEAKTFIKSLDIKVQKPQITYLTPDLINIIKDLLAGRRARKRTVGSIFSDLMMKRIFLFFDENELLDYLRESNRVHVGQGSWFNAQIDRIN